MRPLNILIAGAGPSAMAAVVALQELSSRQNCEFNIKIITTNNQPNYQPEIISDAHKQRFNSSHMYAKESKGSEYGISATIGGFSTIWGAGVNLDYSKIKVDSGFSKEEICKAQELLLKHIPIVGGDIGKLSEESIKFPWYRNYLKIKNNKTDLFKVTSPTLAIETNGPTACRNCGLCLSGCPYGSIWSSEKYLNQQFLQSKIEIIEDKVTHINFTEALCNVKTESGKIFEADKIIMCTGSLETARIFVESNIREEISLSDSQVFYFAGFSFTNTKTKHFSLSQQWIADQADKYKASIYGSNYETLIRLKNNMRKRSIILGVLANRYINNHLFWGIGFLNSNDSGKIIVKRSDNKVRIIRESNPSSRLEIRNFRKKINKQLNHRKTWIVPVLEIPLPGYGFHIGGDESVANEFGLQNFLLDNRKQLLVGDTIQMPQMQPGPHTFTSMMLTVMKILGASR